jgi:HK97 family phage prohead protease
MQPKGASVIFSSVIGGSAERAAEIAVSDGQFVTRWLDVSMVPSRALARVVPRNAEVGDSASEDHAIERAAKRVDDQSSGTAITFRASVESEDRAGDVIKAEGWELDNYRSNPVVLWAHRHDLLPVGKSVDVWIENGALMATVEFAPTEFAQQIYRLFNEGFLRGVSVGFRALKSSPRSGRNGTDHRRGTVFERQELLEISAAPVPMHPLALAAERAEAALGRHASSAGTTRATTTGTGAHNETGQRELIPLFRELTDIWQSIAAVGSRF